MATPVRSTRRSARLASTADAASSPAPPSPHPLYEQQPPATAALASATRQSRIGGSSKSSGSPAAWLALVVLLVAGGVLYSRYVQPKASSFAPGVPASHRSTLEQSEGVEAPPLPELTPEEIAVFEQAAEEHYGLPPGYQAPQFVEDEPQQNYEEESADATADRDQQPLEEEWEGQQEEGWEGQGGEEEHAERHHVERVERQLSRADEEAAAAAAAAFNAEVHRRYLELPPWPEEDESVLTGAWEFTPRVYDYAASLPMSQVLSWDNPRLVLLPSFLSPDEVRHMIKVSKDRLERSEVLVADGEDTQSDIRTSFGFWPDSDPIIDAITERMHRTIGVPQGFGEGLYVLNYQINQKYEAHNDHCMDGYSSSQVADPACLDFLKRAGGPECGPSNGGPTCGDRIATFILYLKSPTKGGKTAFPEADITKAAMGEEHRSGNSPDEWYCSDDRVLSAAPPPGTGVLFWDYRPGNGSGTGSFQDGSAQPNAHTVYAAMHSGCPVEEGEKYIATRWIRSAGFDYQPAAE